MRTWKDNLNGSFNLPIVIDRDSQYNEKLKQELNEYYRKLEEINVPKLTLRRVNQTITNINYAIESFYAGEIIKAQTTIYELLRRYTKNPFICSDLDDSYPLRGMYPFMNANTKQLQQHIAADKKLDLNFFKGRVGDSVQRFERTEMLHIPFNQRSAVSSQRFSIPGLPCQYFGTTSYVCWLELGKPAHENFNVASYHLPKTTRTLNLVDSWSLICGMSSPLQSNDYTFSFSMDDLICTLIELWPLVCATSFKVNEKNRAFRSEYIISQLIMLNLKKLDLDAVAYMSKQVSNDTFTYPICVNLAIPMKPDDVSFSSYAQSTPLSQAINFGEFIYLSPRHPYPSSYINHSFDYTTIVLASAESAYGCSIFGKFDDFLVLREHKSLEQQKLT